jgi:heme-degrading monooxygenase HmoA
MLAENKTWSSGNWQVSEGKSEEFVARWRDFQEWSKEENDGFLGARLVRDLAHPDHFVSFASWRDVDAMRDWQGHPDFPAHFGPCRALCEDMQSGSFDLAVDV